MGEHFIVNFDGLREVHPNFLFTAADKDKTETIRAGELRDIAVQPPDAGLIFFVVAGALNGEDQQTARLGGGFRVAFGGRFAFAALGDGFAGRRVTGVTRAGGRGFGRGVIPVPVPIAIAVPVVFFRAE